MSWLDIVILVVVGYSVFSGLRLGLVRAVIGIVATFLGIVFGFSFYGWVADHLFGGMASRELAKLLGFLVVFGLVLLAGTFLGKAIAKLFQAVGLSWLDHMLGGVFGFVRAMLVVSVLVTVTLAFEPDSVKTSKTLPYVIGASNALASMIPEDVKVKFREKYEELKGQWAKKPA